MYNTAHDLDVINMAVIKAVKQFAQVGDDVYRFGVITGDDLAAWSHVLNMGETMILMSEDFTEDDDDDDEPTMVSSRRIVLSNRRNCHRLENRHNSKHEAPHHAGDRVRR